MNKSEELGWIHEQRDHLIDMIDRTPLTDREHLRKLQEHLRFVNQYISDLEDEIMGEDKITH